MTDSIRPLILISNDDGITAEGIHVLARVASQLGDVVVVAPDGPRSGGSSALTWGTILRPERHADYCGAEMWSLNGTPVDCIKLALHAICNRRPSLVLAGINHGANTGNSVIYSGTMGATIEGCIAGIPSIGYSLITHNPTADDFAACEPLINSLTRQVMAAGLPEGVCLNVNIPAGGNVKGCRRARACHGEWVNEYDEYADPLGKPFYMLTGKYHNLEPEATDTDLYWNEQGYASVVAVVPDSDYLAPLPGITLE